MEQNARRIAAIGILVLCALALNADTITVGKPTIHPNAPEYVSAVDTVLARAALLAGRQYGDLFDISYGETGGDYHIEALVVFDDSGPTGTLTISKLGSSTEHTSFILGEFTEDKLSYYAASFASLWNAFTNGFADDLREPPIYIDELTTDVVGPLLLPENPAAATSPMPMGGATLRDGSLIVGMISAAAKFDPWFRFIGRPGSDQIGPSGYNLAARVLTTPSDAVALVPVSGREYYRVIDGVPGSVKLRVGADVITTQLAVLNDGSMVQKGISASEVTRFDGRKRNTFSLVTSASSYVNLIAAGPDGNLWCWDLTESRIKIFSPDGILLDSIVPIRSGDVFLAPQALVPYPDGGFLLLAPGATGMAFQKFRRDGRPEWVLDKIASVYEEPLPYGVQPVVGRGGADLFLIDQNGKRIIKFYDPVFDARFDGGTADATVERVSELNRGIFDDPDNLEGYEKKAEYYGSIGASELAQATWKQLLDIDPYHGEAQNQLQRYELENLKTVVWIQDRQTRNLLDSRGPENARYQYSIAIRSYEDILAMDPDDTKTAADKRSLEEYFFQQEVAPQDRKKPITVADISIENIFPSLTNYYRTSPAGVVTIRNTLDEPIYDVVARLVIPKYMDFPSEGNRLDSLEAGGDGELELHVALNDAVFALEEDVRLPGKVEIVYFTGTGSDRTEQVVTEYPGVTVHRKTALSWDDSGKIAAFIVPREDVVQRFAINVTRSIDIEVPGIPDRVVRAAALCDAVGTHAIEYIEDPDSPFTEIFGKGEVIDTVRFPRDTLQYRIGDCDDTTALLASLLEAVGVRTAIMTSPGHVFMAFDTNEPDSNAWLFETDELRVISAKGNSWIPIETTTLSDGFYASWKNASRLIIKYPDEIEFLPTADSQSVYPSMPLPAATFAIVEPLTEAVLETLERSLETTSNRLYESAVDRYQSRLDSAGPSRATKYRNQIGVLQARFGHLGVATETLEKLLADSPEYAAAYVNLANIHMLQDQVSLALEVLEKGVERTGGSPVVYISVAQALYQLGRKSEASEAYRQAIAESPRLADRFAYLAGDASTARAGTEPDAPLLWDGGDE
jgi:tetratricopeptide (TPR) repeat protein